MADELAKKISELDNLPNGDMEGFYTIGSKDNAQGNPVSYKMDLVVLKNAIAAAAAAVANANAAVSAAQAAQAAFLDAIVQQTGQNTAKVMSQKAVTDALAAMSDTITTLTGRIGDIRDIIPSAASASNQLADKAFVNSSIATATAEFRGTYNSLAELQAVSADQNDYGYVRTTDAAGNTVFKRYKYASGSWVFEYDLNNSSFTASQWAAINSAITAELVEKLRALPTNAALTELLNGKQGVIADLDTIRANATAVSSKTDKPSSAVAGNFAKFDANRNPVDAGYSASRVHRDLGYNAAETTIVLTPGETGKYVKCSTRSAVANAAFNISAPFNVDACSELLIKTGYNPSDGSHAALDISVIAIYEEMERTRTIQKKNASNQPLYYEVDEEGNPTTTETTTVTDYPVYTTETYTEHRYLPNNEDRWVAIPDSGYYVANIPQSCKCVISYKPGVTDLTVVVVKHGALANLTSQIFGIYEHRTMAEAVVSLAVRLNSLEKRLQQPGDLKVGTIDAVTITRYLYPDVLEQDGAPSASVRPTNIDDALPWDGIPVYPGQRLHDNANKKVYEAFAPCTAISDWVLLN